MCAQVLLNLLNKLRKRDKMLGKPRILSLFCNMFNKFNNTGARMLDSIYHMTLKLLSNRVLGEKFNDFAIYARSYYGHHYIAFPKSVIH